VIKALKSMMFIFMPSLPSTGSVNVGVTSVRRQYKEMQGKKVAYLASAWKAISPLTQGEGWQNLGNGDQSLNMLRKLSLVDIALWDQPQKHNVVNNVLRSTMLWSNNSWKTMSFGAI